MMYWLRTGPVTATTEAIIARVNAASPTVVIDGIRIVNVDDEGHSELFFDKVRTALSLVVEYVPFRYQQIRGSIEVLTIMPSLPDKKLACYLVGTGRCCLSREIVDGSPVDLARVLVHESVHARIDKMRVRHSADRLNRIERQCLRSEIDFVSRLPPTPSREAWLARHLVRLQDSELWR